jgi:transposase-like protein
MPTSASCLLFLGLFGIAWVAIAWRPHLPLQGHPAVAPKVPRRLKPRTPLDCPACWPPAPFSTLHSPVRAPIRPWREVKSRRGAPKRIPTQGFACPMPTCLYYQITDAYVHALVGDGSHGKGERIQTFRCQSCRTTFGARRDTPLYRLKTQAPRVGEVLTALCEGLDVANTGWGAERACINAPCSISPSHISNWTNYAPGCVARRKFSGCGWRLTPSASSYRCSIWEPGRRTQLMPLSPRFASSSSPPASPCSPAMG